MIRARADKLAAGRAALEQARHELPPRASRWATEDPVNPGSLDTLADFEELMEQNEYEVALYSLARIAKGAGAGPECWRYLEDAARLMRFGRQERARAHLP